MTPLYDWSRVAWFGGWSQADAEAFARRVETIARCEYEEPCLADTPDCAPCCGKVAS
jgi:hypothetical protein